MKITILAAAAALAFTSHAAAAQDGIRVYGGPIVGYDRVGVVLVDQATQEKEKPGSEDGVMYGGVVGLDYQIAPGSIFGIEAEFTDADTDVGATGLLTATDSARVTAGRDWYVGVRGAYFVSPRILFYGKVGYTNARIVGTYNDGAGTIEQDHIDRDGIRLGLGLEFVINKNIGLRTEYRRSEYKSADSGLGFDVDAHRDQIVAGLVAGF